MKLLNILAITAIGTLFAAGCSSTTTITNTDGGADSATGDSGKTDTGKADTGTTPTDTGSDAGDPEAICKACVESKCSAELAACNASTTAAAGCKALIDCLVACTTAECQNACINDSMSTEGKNFVNCVYVDKCQMECTGG